MNDTPEEIEGEAEEIVTPQAPPPQGPVTPVGPEQIPTECGNCKSRFTFPVQPNVEEFSFECAKCGSVNRWSRR